MNENEIIAIEFDEPHLVVQVKPFQGEQRFDIRHMYTNKNGATGFTKKGVNLPLSSVLAFIDTLLEAYNRATDNEYIIATHSDVFETKEP